MNYSPMYMYESSPMHIHKIILLTPRDRRQIVGVTLKVLRRRRGGGSDEAVRYKSRCSVALKDARFLRHGGRARFRAMHTLRVHLRWAASGHE